LRAWIAALLVLTGTGCAGVWPGSGEPAASETTTRIARPASLPPSPAAVPPGATGDSATWWKALAADELRIVVSREKRWLWLVRGDSTLFTAPVAVGRDTIFRYGDRSWDFNTPTGRLEVLDKEESPEWVPPDWHYLEIAVERGLEPVRLGRNQRVALSDDTWILVRDGEVGRVNRFGYWRAFTPGSVIVFDDKIFIPPIPSPQRRIPEILGTHRLILGDGYLIHGTPKVESIGEYASHGCVRMFNHDIEALYGMVERGVPVYIY
jgi:lipoprotein-anchoring transpeptidase ErfK/SrfK